MDKSEQTSRFLAWISGVNADTLYSSVLMFFVFIFVFFHIPITTTDFNYLFDWIEFVFISAAEISFILNTPQTCNTNMWQTRCHRCANVTEEMSHMFAHVIDDMSHPSTSDKMQHINKKMHHKNPPMEQVNCIAMHHIKRFASRSNKVIGGEHRKRWLWVTWSIHQKAAHPNPL